MTADTPAPGGRRNGLDVIELLLRNRQRFFQEIREGVDLRRKMIALWLYASLFLALFGAVIGSEHSAAQALASAVKLPLLFFITMLVCLPTLYFFNTIFEASLSLSQNGALLLTAITMTAIVLIAFAPVLLFFMITAGGYQFFKLLNVGIFAIGGWIGIRYLAYGMAMLTATDRRGAKARGRLLRVWMLLYAFVGTQMAWTLRPFFGAPDLPFELFRGLGGNFYADIFASLGEVLGFFIVR